MAEYGLYGAMVRHSLPLPETIIRQEQAKSANSGKQQSNRSSRNSANSDNEISAQNNDNSNQNHHHHHHNNNDSNSNNADDSKSDSEDNSTAPWLLGMHKKSLEISGRLKSANQALRQSDQVGESSSKLVEVNKKRELSSIYMSVKRILANNQPEEEEEEVERTNCSPVANCSRLSAQMEAQNRLKKSKVQQQQQQQQKRRLSKAAAQKLAEMRQMQLEEGANCNLEPLRAGESRANLLDQFARYPGEPIKTSGCLSGASAYFQLAQQPPLLQPQPTGSSANQLAVHQLWYPSQQQQQQQSAREPVYGPFAGEGQFGASSSQLHHLFAYQQQQQQQQAAAKRLHNQQQQFALDPAGQSHEQAQQLLMAAAATISTQTNQTSGLWLNEWMQRYMQSAMLAAQQQQQLANTFGRQPEQADGSARQRKVRRRNNFKNVANLIEQCEPDEADDIDVVRPFVSSSLSQISLESEQSDEATGNGMKLEHKQCDDLDARQEDKIHQVN